MTKQTNWAIIGTGQIAAKFASDLRHVPNAKLLAVGSRSAESADTFAKQFDIPRPYPTYEQLIADPDIDVVYIATPHPFHEANVIACANAGKAVLCEKPFALNASQAKRMIDAARSNNTFLLEAMWTRFIPMTVKIRQLLGANTIGDIRMLQADFGYSGSWAPKSRIMNPYLAGGALLDIGVYAISMASMIFRSAPAQIAALAHIGDTGIDELSAFIFRYDQGALANLSCSITAQTPGEAVIAGKKGRIKIQHPFWHAKTATISIPGKPDETIEIPYKGNGLHYQAIEVMDCLASGKLESDIMPLDETLQIMQTMDDIRRKWKLRYPAEKDNE